MGCAHCTLSHSHNPPSQNKGPPEDSIWSSALRCQLQGVLFLVTSTFCILRALCAVFDHPAHVPTSSFPLFSSTKQATLFSYEAGTDVRVRGITTTIHKAKLTGANLWTKASVSQFDAQWASEANNTRSWLVNTVHISATVSVQWCTASGEELPTVSAEKTGSWLFLRGPLPRGFSNDVTAPWRVVAWS